MAGGIWGDGPRGGIFGARIDPRLQAELERRATLERGRQAQVGAQSGGGGWGGEPKHNLARRIIAAPSKLFGGLVVDPAVEGVTDLVTLAGDVYRGRQPTMSADPQTGEMHTDPRLIERTANAAGALTLGAGAIPAEVNALRMGIKAYHGSPHDFAPEPGAPLGRFRSEKVGTGEGGQAFGMGHYLAEAEGTAKTYKDMATDRDWSVEDSGRIPAWVGRRLEAGEPVDEYLKMFKARIGEAEERVASQAPQSWNDQANIPGLQQIVGSLEKIKAGAKPVKPGKMYETEIAADPEQFIDLDAPLSAQPPHARDKLESHQRYRVEPAGDKTWKVLHPGGWVPEAAKNFYRSEEAALQAAEKLNQARSVSDLVPRTSEQSKALSDLGIPGIKFLDQGSRTAGEGTRNFVIFHGNEHLISILRKYGLPISAAGLAALSQLHPEEAQAAQRGGR